MRIECRKGQATVPVAGETYSFDRDEHGRFTCIVEEPRHIECFISRADMYRQVPERPSKVRQFWPNEIDPDTGLAHDAQPLDDAGDDDVGLPKARRARRPRADEIADASAAAGE